ncbi:MAG: phosphate signaling complex protein PhoU [Anaerolineaceae bacterium]|nr:phosphate signaling complex protein PhoU [Anaerolineaceae bacterium]
MRRQFDQQLDELNTMLIEMGMMVESAIASSIEALEKQDPKLARQAIFADNKIDQKERDIEALCLKLLLQQQPVAKDLRLISAALKMITDMERIGDQASDISEISIYLMNSTLILNLEHIPQMAKTTARMVTQSIDAFVKKDLALAFAVIESDDEVDRLFDVVKNDLIQLIAADSRNGEQAIDLLMITKYLERIGDHATNIAEWVVFSITGKHNKAEEMADE